MIDDSEIPCAFRYSTKPFNCSTFFCWQAAASASSVVIPNTTSAISGVTTTLSLLTTVRVPSFWAASLTTTAPEAGLEASTATQPESIAAPAVKITAAAAPLPYLKVPLFFVFFSIILLSFRQAPFSSGCLPIFFRESIAETFFFPGTFLLLFDYKYQKENPWIGAAERRLKYGIRAGIREMTQIHERFLRYSSTF